MLQSITCYWRDAGRGWEGRCGVLILAIAMAVSGVAGRAESGPMPAAPAGVVETGASPFVVLSPELLGFSTPPSDLHVLPDGRILVVSHYEIAIGDGVRWETFQQAPNQSGFIDAQVAVDDDGRIYTGIPGAIARIDLGEDARWRFVPVVSVPAGDPYARVVQFPDTWLWGPAGGIVIAWRPGQIIRTSRLSAPIEQFFAVGNERFASSESSGSLYQLHFGGDATPIPLVNARVTGGVTGSADYGREQMIVGTTRDGLRAFDGRSFGDVSVPKILGPGHRINDLCQVGTDLYAAAVDRTGILLFERGGRVVQMLTRMLDHRLGRPRRLVYARNGVLWTLLDNAVACVQVPSPISNFEPILASSMSYVQPLRHEGELWVLADGRLLRGVYNPDGYLERFELDMPPVTSVWAIAETGGRLFATSEEGIFIREGSGWQQVATGIINARLGIGRAQSDGQIFYVARGEIGWIRESAGQFAVQRIPVKDLGEVYNAVEDSTGAVWLELGQVGLGRVEFDAGGPTVRFFGKKEGVAGSWPSPFILDGVVRCTTHGQVFCFDARTQRFVEDEELIRRIPALVGCTGRPARDASGRLWFASRGTVSFVDDTRTGEKPTVGSLPLGFEPTEFKMEADSVIWMQAREHLTRFDPRVPPPPSYPLHVQITSVQLAASNHHIFTPGPTLSPLPYSDNSLVVRFSAASSPFGPPVSFEVMLEGATDQWMSTGNVGLASFNRLKEGRYVFHVRPVVAGMPGEESRLNFTVQPPWFRTKLAWVIYISSAVSLVLLVAWLFSYLERREAARLGHLVAARTAELHATNAQLGRQIEETMEKTAALTASEERYHRLNTELESRVAERTAELSKANADLKREIAERQHAEEALREGEERFTSFMRHLPGLAFLKDHERRILFVNESFEKCFDIPVAQWLGKTNEEIWPGEVGQKIRRDDEAVLASGQTRAILEEVPTRGELRTYRTIKFAIPRPDGRSWLGGVSIDITELKRAEDEKEKLQVQLAQAQKMESVGRLAGGVAHDFNNMLQAILGNVALALENLPPGSALRENLEEIHKSAQRSAELTRQLLAFARKQTIQPKVIDLNDTIAGMLKMLRRLIGEAIHLAWMPGADLWPVKVDPSQVDQILANLCVNARDAIAGVGKVTIETSNVKLDATYAQSHLGCVPGDYVLMAVSDNGQGMDAATRAHLFEPFFTTKEIGKGTGLGLATVFGAVIQNQGLINVDSVPGQGTTFKIYLPRAKADAVAAAQESVRRSQRGTETVLLVEDEEQVLNLSRQILEQYGYTVLALPTPKAALDLAARHAGPLHLLITDVVMPEMNGKELRDRLRTSHPDLKCLFMSGYTADVIAGSGVLDDGVHFIQKPFTIETLVDTVRSVCEAG